MQSRQELEKEMTLNQDLTELLDVLKGIAISQYHSLERNKKERFAKFTDAFEGFFHMIDFAAANHPFSRAEGALGIVLITSDEGFMGGLNAQVIERGMMYPESSSARMIVVGERGQARLRAMGRKFTGFPGITEETRYEAALKLKDYIMNEALEGSFGRLIIIHPKPLSFMVQKVDVLTVLPCSELFEKQREIAEDKERVITESSLHDIIEYLLGMWVTQKLFEVFEDSKLAEFLARTGRLEESHQTLLKRGETVRHQYFRSVHEFIDKGMRETFSAQIMRKKAKRSRKE